MDWYEIVPKDLQANLRFRVDLRRQCEQDAGLRERMMDACREDVLFFFSAFCFLHEPRTRRDAYRRPLPQVIPFIPWSHQVPIIRTIREKLGEEEVGVEKARGEGMSWIAVLMALHDWLFAVPGKDMVTIGLVSRNMEMADSPSDISSLFAKIDWEMERLPTWMIGEKSVDWKRQVTNHTLRNYRNGSLITAYAATGEVGSGGRYTYWIIDELSKFRPGEDRDAVTSTQQTTESRLIIGTPYGATGAYYDIMHEPSSMEKLVLAWEDNPTRNRGLYRMIRGVPVAVDPASNPLPPHYNPPNNEVQAMFARLRKKGFILEKRIRSPWYDRECDRPDADPSSIAQELDRDYGGSLHKIFTEDFYSATNRTVRPPFARINIEYNPDSLRPSVIGKAADGELLLWTTLDYLNRPPQHPYVASCDISAGRGTSYTSNSVLVILDLVTGEQVGELVTNTTPPDAFADKVMAICYWLGDAYLAWERNGPGLPFSDRVKEMGYPDVFMRPLLTDKRRRKKTKEPGWWSDAKSKEIMLAELRRVVAVEQVKVRSKSLVEESHQYVRIGKAIEHVANARAKPDDPDKNDNHGDRVIALGVGVMAARDRPVDAERLVVEQIQPGSIEERDREWAKKLAEQDDDWDDRSNWDLMTGSTSAPGW